MTDAPALRPPWLRFDRHELAGAFGDIGTDLPLLIALVLGPALSGVAQPVSFDPPRRTQ